MILWLMFFPVFMSLTGGLLRAVVYRNWDSLIFAVKIIKGNFITGQDGTFLRRFALFLSRLFWEQPQTLMGNIAMHLLNSVGLVKSVEYYKQVTVCQCSFLQGGGMALGSFVLIDLLDAKPVIVNPINDRSSPVKVLIRHEYGHVLQSILSGPLYLFKYGIPSLIMQGWTERDADLRSDRNLLYTDQMMPAFHIYNSSEKLIGVKIWEYILFFGLVIIGIIFDGVQGMLAGYLLSAIIISFVNLNKKLA